MSDFARFVSENREPKPVETPRVNFGARLQQDIMRQREEERRRVAAIVAGSAPPNMDDLRLNAQASQELGVNLPTQQTPEMKSFIEQQIAASRLIRAFEDAPLTTRWAATLENAQLIRNSAEAMAQAERIFSRPATFGGQVADTIRGIPRAAFPTLGAGATGSALAFETAERTDLQTRMPELQQQLRLGAANIERAANDPDAEDGFAESVRMTVARELRHIATAGMSGEDSRNAVYDIAARIEAGEDPLTLLDELSEIAGKITPAPERPLYELGEYIGDLFKSQLASPRAYEGSLPSQFGEAIGSFSAFMATSFLAGPIGSFYLAGAAGIDEQYNRARAAGLDHDAAMQFAIEGAPAGLIQALSVEFAMRRLPIPAKRRFGTVLKDLTATGLAETTVETAGAIMQNVIEQKYNEERGTFEDTIGAGLISGSAAATLRAVALAAIPGARRSLFRDIERAEASAEMEQTMQALRDGLEGNELREAVPDRFRSWAESVVSGNPERDTVYVSPQGLQELAQSANNPEIVQRVIDALPGVTQAEFDAALQQGTDLAIPMATWMTDVIGTQVDLMLAEHIRFDPNNMTTFERVTRATQMAQEMRELAKRVADLEAENITAEVTPLERAKLTIYNEARARITQAGFTARAADHYAAQYSAIMARTAERSRLSLDEFLARYPAADINIDGQVIDMRREGDPATFDDVLEELRTAEEGVDLTPEAERARQELELLGIDPRTLTNDQIAERLQSLMDEQAAAAAPEATDPSGRTPPPLDAAAARAGTLAQLLSSTSSIVNQGERFEQRVGPNNEGPWFNSRPTTTPDTPLEFMQGAQQFKLRDRPADARRWKAQLDRADKDSKTRGSFEMPLGRVPLPLVVSDMGEGQLIMHYSKIKKVRDKHQGVTENVLRNLPIFMAAPAAIYLTPNHPKSKYLVILPVEGTNGGPVVVAIGERAKSDEPMTIGTHFVATVFEMGAGEDAAELQASKSYEGASLLYEATPGAAEARLLSPRISGAERRGKLDQLRALDHSNARGRRARVLTYADVVNTTGQTFMQSGITFSDETLTPQLAENPPRLPDLEAASPGPVAGVRALASKYMDRMGLPIRHQASYVRVDIERATEIARLYEEMKHDPFDADVRTAYEALARETIAQYEALLELGFTFEFIDGADPYATPADAIRDMQNNKHLWVFSTEDGYGQEGITDADRAENPMLQPTGYTISGRTALVNDLFRVVHDVFGHGSEGASFGPRGEENAWQAHVRMFTPLAARAMTTETRGQNSWVNYGPHGAANRADPANTVYAEQKIGLLPEWVSNAGQAYDAPLANRPQLPVRADGLVELHHWSGKRLDVVDPQFAGTGPYQSRERRAGKKLSFFGIAPRKTRREAGTGYVKEPNLGGIHHIVAVDPQKLYPYFEDPDNLMARVEERVAEIEKPSPSGRRRVSGPQRVDMYEEAIREAGYLGYYVTEDGSGRAPLGNVAVAFEALKPETAYSEDSGQVFYQGDAPSGWYYSALTNAVENAKQKSATAKDWKAIIPKMAGVKKAEIDWSGVMQWLDWQQGQVSREEVARYLRSQEIEIEELVGTEDGIDWENITTNDISTDAREPDASWIEETARDLYYDDALADLVQAAEARPTGRLSAWDIGDDAKTAYLDTVDADDAAAIEAAEDFDWQGEAAQTLLDQEGNKSLNTSTPMHAAIADEVTARWSEFEEAAQNRAEAQAREAYFDDPEYDVQLDVGNRTFRATQDSSGEVYDSEISEGFSDLDEWLDSLRHRVGDDDIGVRWGQYTERGGEEYREILLTIPNLEAEGPNRGRRVSEFVEENHFVQPNVVVHARVKSRVKQGQTNRAGVLFVEEIQSDLGTDWREAGGQPAGFVEPTANENDPDLVAARAQHRAARQRHETAIDRRNQTARRMQEVLAEAGLPQNLAPAASAARAAELGSTDVRSAAQHIGVNVFSDDGEIVVQTAQQVFDAAQSNTQLMDALLEYYGALTDLRGAETDLSEATRNLRWREDAAQPNVPDIPFTPFDGQIAYEVMLKRLLNLAAQEGRDALAWTPGYMQAERWSGAVQNVVNTIEWSTETRAERRALDVRQVRNVYVGALTDPAPNTFSPMARDEAEAVVDDYIRQVRAQLGTGMSGLEIGSPAYEDSDLIRRVERTERGIRSELEGALTTEVEGRTPTITPAQTFKKVVLDGRNGADVFLVDDTGVIREKLEGRIPADQAVGKNMSELIGGPMTRAILDGESGRQGNQNIVVGGDGYKIAYDQQMKKFVEKWAKKYGGTVRVETLPDFDNRNEKTMMALRRMTGQQLLRVIELTRGAETAEEVRNLALQRVERQRATIHDGTMDMMVRLQNDLSVLEQRRDATPEHLADLRARVELQEQAYEWSLNAVKEVREPDFVIPDEELHRVAITSVVPTQVVASEQARAEFAELDIQATRPVWFIDITDEMRAAALQPQPLFQNNRGKIVLPPRYQRPTITLFEGADLSTLLHEMGHQYLYILQDLASTGDMGAEQARDWAVIQQWWRNNAAGVASDAGNGVTEADVLRYLDDGSTGDHAMDNAINIGLHEQWARAFEGYLLEGKSPSLSLAEAFRSFKAWLVAVYRRAEQLRVNISPEMRDVFDRMLATEEEIRLARETEAVDRLVADSAEALGISEDEYRRLVELHDEAREEAEQRLTAHIMEPIRRQRQAEYRRERAAVEEEKRREHISKPVHRLREWIGNRRWLDGDAPEGLPTNMRLDRQQLIDRYGEDRLRLLPRGTFPLYSRANETGMDLDEVAGWFGFSSGDAMVNELTRMPSLDAAVKAETDAEMQRRYPDPAKDDSVEAAAVEAMHGDKAGQLLVAELRALSKLAGVKGTPTPRQQAREVARRTIAGMVARKAIRSHVWQAAERKAATDAQEALARGDRQGAFDAKRRQLMNHMLYSESRRAEELVAKLENRAGRLKRKGVREKLAGEYLAAIDDLLGQYEFRRVSGRQLDRRNALVAYVEMMAAEGRENELAIPAQVLENARQINYMELTVEHMQGLLDAMVNIEHTARYKQRLRDKKAERDLLREVDSVVKNMQANVRGKPRGRIATNADRRRNAARQYLNLVLNAGTILRKMDGFKDMGAAYRAIKHQIDLATRDLTERRAQLAERIEQLYGAYTRSEMNNMSIKRHNDVAGFAMSKWDVISVALNMGNVDNLERLTDQNSRGFTRDQVDRIVAELDDRDWSFVQGMWDLIDSYWGEIAARERRLTGVAPKKVEAVPFQTPTGRTLRGGYYPIMYDGELSAQVNTEQTEELMKNMQAGKFGKAQTANGHLKERKQGSGGRPLALGIEVAHRHLGRVVHDLAMSEAVNNTWRILQHPKLRSAFADKGLLHDLETLELWVQDVAAGQLAAADLPSRVFRRLKSNFTLAKLGFNMSTVLVQLTGLAQSSVVVGHKNFALAMIKYAARLPSTVQAVEAKSEFMQRRQTTFNKDINDILGDVTLGPLEAGWDKAMRKYAGPAAFWLMQKVQYYGVDVPTWTAAYDKGLRDGLSEADAVANADATVERAQAGGEFSSRSAFERGTTSRSSRQSDMIRLFTTLGSYMFAKFNVAYERTGRAQRVFRDEGFSLRSVREAISYAFDMAFLFILEAFLYAAIMGRLPGGDDEEADAAAWAAFLARETAFGVAATLPFVRDVTGPMQGFAAGGAYGGITQEIADVTVRPFIMLEDEEISLAGVKALTRGVGLASGLPSTATNRIIDGVWRQNEGEDVALIEYLVGRR